MKCGIVILNYDSYNSTYNMVKKALSIDLIDKVVLVDDDSNNDFSPLIKEVDNARFEYIKKDNIIVDPARYNIGLKYLKSIGCDYAFLTKPNVLFNYRTINNILEFLEQHNNYAVTSCIRTVDGVIEGIGQFWMLSNFTETLLESLRFGRKHQMRFNNSYIKRTLEQTKDKNFIDVEALSCSFFGCNLKILEDIDYFDENSFLWYEENDLFFKIKEKGYKVAHLKNCSYEYEYIVPFYDESLYKMFSMCKRHYCKQYLKVGTLRLFLLHIFEIMRMTEMQVITRKNKKVKKGD